MITLHHQVFGNSSFVANTFIGGVAATINTPVLLATKLSIDISHIKKFRIVGNNIEAVIDDFTLQNSAFLNDNTYTYFKSTAVRSLGYLTIFRNNSEVTDIYIPYGVNTSAGSNVTNSYVFNGLPKIKKIDISSITRLHSNFINLANITLEELKLTSVTTVERAAIRGVKNSVISMRKLKNVINFPTSETLPYITTPLETARIEINSFLLTSNNGGIDTQTLTIKTLYPNVTIAFYDDNNNLVSTL